MPRVRRPALHSAETSFRGKGAAACLCRPRPFQVGVFFMRAASRTVWNSPPSPHVGEEKERGKQAVVPSAALPPSFLHILTETASNVCWGGSTVCRRTSTRGSSRMGRLPSWVYGLRDLSGGEPVRLSGHHTADSCGVRHWRFPYVPLPWVSPAVGTSVATLPPPVWLLCRAQRVDSGPPVAGDQPAMVR